MAILNVNVNQIGQTGIFPAIISILTNDTLATVTESGYLNGLVRNYNIPLSEADIALVTTKTSPSSSTTSVGWFGISKSGESWSLVSTTAPGNVILPTIANHIATYTNTDGTLSEDPATAISGGNIQAGLSGTAGALISYPAIASTGSLELAASSNAGNTVTQITNASQAGARTYTIPDGGQVASNFLLSDSSGTQTINTGSLALAVGNFTATEGNITAGSSGHAGSLISYPATASTGSLQLVAASNAGNTVTEITNASMGQASTITIPDPGAASANFLLSTGTANILAFEQFVGIDDVILIQTGTWTKTRIAQGNYAYENTPAAQTSIIAIDITPMIRTAASKGFELTSFDIVYAITAEALTAHTTTLNEVVFANNTAVTITQPTITGTLATATQTNPYVTNIVVSTPAFLNTSDSKYVVEVTVNAQASSAYAFYGINLYFNQTIA